MTYLDPLLSLQPYQASHIFPGPTTFTKSEYGRLAEITHSQQGHESHDRGAPKSELQNHVIT